MSTHISAAEFQRYLGRAIPPVELIALDDHLSECASCRDRLSTFAVKWEAHLGRKYWLGEPGLETQTKPDVINHISPAEDAVTAGEMSRSTPKRETVLVNNRLARKYSFSESRLFSNGHLTYEALEGCVDNALVPSESVVVLGHGRACRTCSYELTNLQTFAAQLNAPAPESYQHALSSLADQKGKGGHVLEEDSHEQQDRQGEPPAKQQASQTLQILRAINWRRLLPVLGVCVLIAAWTTALVLARARISDPYVFSFREALMVAPSILYLALSLTLLYVLIIKRNYVDYPLFTTYLGVDCAVRFVTWFFFFLWNGPLDHYGSYQHILGTTAPLIWAAYILAVVEVPLVVFFRRFWRWRFLSGLLIGISLGYLCFATYKGYQFERWPPPLDDYISYSFLLGIPLKLTYFIVISFPFLIYLDFKQQIRQQKWRMTKELSLTLGFFVWGFFSLVNYSPLVLHFVGDTSKVTTDVSDILERTTSFLVLVLWIWTFRRRVTPLQSFAFSESGNNQVLCPSNVAKQRSEQ